MCKTWLLIVLWLVTSTLVSAQSDLMYPTSRCGVYAGAEVLNYPPIQNDMTWDLVISLIAADSACRVSNVARFADSISHLSDDSLQIGLISMMNLRRYYPIWMIHLMSLSLDSYPEGYLMTYGDVYNTIIAEYLARNSTLSDRAKEMFYKDAVFVGEIKELSHDHDSVFYPYEGSTRCYRISVVDKIIGNHIFPVGDEGADEVVLSVIYYENIMLPCTTLGYAFDRAEYDKLEVGGSYLFYVDVFPDRREQDVGNYQIMAYPGSFFRITDDSIVNMFDRFGTGDNVIPLTDALSIILNTYNEALRR
jgi:hypothetical protein